MATKYIISGAAFYGDGTSSSEATVDGGVGAWNNTNIITGTAPSFGTAPTAGDTVYIRSKTSAGANISITQNTAVNIGRSSATAANPIKWVLDNGTIWSGIDGTFTMKKTTTDVSYTLLAYNIFEARTPKAFILANEVTGTFGSAILTLKNGAILKNGWWQYNNVSHGTGSPCVNFSSGVSFGGFAILENPVFDLNVRWYPGVVTQNDSSTLYLINPQINLPAVFGTYPMFGTGNYGAGMIFYGGSISGAGATTGTYLTNSTGTATRGLEMYGTKYPKALATYPTNVTGQGGRCIFYGFGMDGGFGAFKNERYGQIDSRSDNFYPLLNSVFPDTANTKWAWKIFPNNSSIENPIDLPAHKVYTDTAAVKTVTLELLVADTFPTVTKGQMWIDVCYKDDSTGVPTYVSSSDYSSTTALTTSTAGWSTTTYGAVNLLKRKIEVTTPTAIKQNSIVTVTLRGWATTSSSNDIMFVDGDPQLT